MSSAAALGDEDARVERYKAQERARAAAAAQTQDKVVTLPRRDRPEAAGEATASTATATADAEERIRAFAGENTALADSLLALRQADPSLIPTGSCAVPAKPTR